MPTNEKKADNNRKMHKGSEQAAFQKGIPNV